MITCVLARSLQQNNFSNESTDFIKIESPSLENLPNKFKIPLARTKRSTRRREKNRSVLRCYFNAITCF
ncbi:hypothetical protein KQX54_008132 [Cotesia glomerata]|uniref:Uncharacterized protein n=1 Tax=Cotesia glomerata TaxID=32391 RepID=A0AAV7HDE1_COTGL|nr:hypothetical protein KQX54_008132 [Cotesia glomerata]